MGMNVINITSNSILQLQQKITLTPGQLLKGQVVEVQGNQVVLQLSAGILSAQARTRLKPGQKLNLVVESVKNGIISLKVLPEGKKIKPESLLLLRMGIKPQENMEKVLQEFFRFQLPLNPDHITQITTFGQENNLSNEMIQLAVWLRSVGIKTNSHEDVRELEKLYRFFQGKLSQKDEIRYFRFINQLENTSPGGYNISGCSIDGNHIYLLTSDSGSQNLQPAMSNIIMKLNSQVLQELWVKMNTTKNQLNIHILCPNQKGYSLLNTEINTLKKTLASTGYHLAGLKIEKGQANTIFDFIPAHRPEITGINLKV